MSKNISIDERQRLLQDHSNKGGYDEEIYMEEERDQKHRNT